MLVKVAIEHLHHAIFREPWSVPNPHTPEYLVIAPQRENVQPKCSGHLTVREDASNGKCVGYGVFIRQFPLNGSTIPQVPDFS